MDVALRKAAAREAAKVAAALTVALERLPPAPETGDPLEDAHALYAALGAAMALIPSAVEPPAPLALAPPPAEESPTPKQSPRRKRQE